MSELLWLFSTGRDVQTFTFDAMVEPVLCYASPVWEYQPYICIERVQVNFCKRLCGLNQNVDHFFGSQNVEDIHCMLIIYISV